MIRLGHVIQAPNTDHKELIQIAGKDRNKFHPLQKRNRRILCLFQNPVIEFQPGKLSVLCIIQHFFVHNPSPCLA